MHGKFLIGVNFKNLINRFVKVDNLIYNRFLFVTLDNSFKFCIPYEFPTIKE